MAPATGRARRRRRPARVAAPGASVSPVPSDEIFPRRPSRCASTTRSTSRSSRSRARSATRPRTPATTPPTGSCPEPAETCDNCHDVDHADQARVRAGKGSDGQCALLPRRGRRRRGRAGGAAWCCRAPNLRFAHGKHLARNIQCGQCHGQVAELELATRDQLPRMAGCFACHDMTRARPQGDAKGDCTTCHLTQPDGRLQTAFAAGDLVPPRWLHGAAHDADWIERHKTVAADDSSFCASCHTVERVHRLPRRQRAAAQGTPQRLALDAPPGGAHGQPALLELPRTSRPSAPTATAAPASPATPPAATGRPAGASTCPPSEWTTAPARPHPPRMGGDAQPERLRLVPQRARLRRRATPPRASPAARASTLTPPGFQDKCGLALRRNPRPCYVCHQSQRPLRCGPVDEKSRDVSIFLAPPFWRRL